MKFFPVFLCCLLLAGCASGSVPVSAATPTLPETLPTETVPADVPTDPEPPSAAPAPVDPVRQMISDMSLEQRVGQLFLARCNPDTAVEDVRKYHLGGLVLFGSDFENQTPDSMRQTIADYQDAAEKPLLIAVDEEGGDVTRISQFPAFREKRFSSLRKRYEQGGLEAVLTEEEEKCRLLSDLGINVNLGPVCDITTEPEAFMYSRSLGQDAQTTAEVTASTVNLMNAFSIGSVLKHFPGYGNNADTHIGIAVDTRALSELEEQDLVPYTAGIQAGCGAVMVGHIVVEALDAEFPASLSPAVHRYLRDNLEFTGVIMTDDLVMQAITDQYGAGEAAVMAVLAGNDLLCSTEYAIQYQAVLQAVLDGRIDIDVLNSAVRNVLEWKISLGLL
ncbi:MAG: glycoside hydrolase family 3 N-terminal domain-containing protein [Candidatus Faecousia sp.]|nr:beta-hexosaminidase [Clostridiales bacterium]MDY4599400.1 glycoside hydrolase family 3 N-terminal domain-containing protein [Candidatus Faecousia sp.]